MELRINQKTYQVEADADRDQDARPADRVGQAAARAAEQVVGELRHERDHDQERRAPRAADQSISMAGDRYCRLEGRVGSGS